MTKTTSHLTRRGILLGLGGTALTGCAAVEGVDLSQLGGILQSTSGFGSLTQADAAAGIRAALTNGVGNAISTIGVNNGFLLNNLIRIPLPGFLSDAQTTLSRVGLSGPLDNLETQLNRGAEAAVPVARDIFVDAIQSLTISDAINIVQGPSNAATQFLQERTTSALTQRFTPIMNNALQQAGAIQTFDQIAQRSQNIPFAPQLGEQAKSDLIRHGVDFGLSGMFTYIGREEAAIRSNPAKRTSEILQRVFG